MEELMSKLRQMRDAVYQRLDIFTAAFDAWKEPWTEERASFLDVPVSTRADQETSELIAARIADPMAQNTDTVMGKLNSLLGFGVRVEYKNPGSYSWTVPSGVTKIKVMIVGAGGGGAGGSAGVHYDTITGDQNAHQQRHIFSYVGQGGAGGSGAYQVIQLPVAAGQKYTIVVGAKGQGGAGGTSYSGFAGGSGGASSFGSYVSGGGHGGKAAVTAPTHLANRDNNLSTKPATSSGAGGAGGTVGNPNAAEILEYRNGVAGTAGQFASVQEGFAYYPSPYDYLLHYRSGNERLEIKPPPTNAVYTAYA